MNIKNFKSALLNYVGLQTPKARLVFFCTIPLIMYLYSLVSFLPRLSIYSWLRIPSPSIGLTRAFWMLISGDITGAWYQNKLIFLVVAVVLYLVTRDIFTLLKQRRY